MTQTPDTWLRVPLLDVLEKTIGGVWGVAPGAGEIDVRVFRVTELRPYGRIDPTTAALRSISYSQLETRRLQQGDILLEKSGGGPNTPVGRIGLVKLVEGDTVCANFMQLLRPDSSLIDANFLAWQLVWRHSSGETAALQTATTNIRNLRTKDYLASQVVIPSVSEQRRVGEAIEAAFSKLDAGVAYLEAAKARTRTMLSAILNAAVERHDVVALGELALEVRNGIFVSRPSVSPPGVPILRIGALRPLRLDMADHGYALVNLEDPKVLRAVLVPGDLLFTRYNGNPEFVGACAVVPKTNGAVLHPDKLIRVRIDRERVLPKFVAISAAVGRTRRFIESVTKTTAGQAGISGADLRKAPIPLPNLEAQQRIVDAVEESMSTIDATNHAMAQELRRASALRRSILAAAFSGQLVVQEPSDESADALLERIAATRVTEGTSLQLTRRRSPAAEVAT